MFSNHPFWWSVFYFLFCCLAEHSVLHCLEQSNAQCFGLCSLLMLWQSTYFIGSKHTFSPSLLFMPFNMWCFELILWDVWLVWFPLNLYGLCNWVYGQWRSHFSMLVWYPSTVSGSLQICNSNSGLENYQPSGDCHSGPILTEWLLTFVF